MAPLRRFALPLLTTTGAVCTFLHVAACNDDSTSGAAPLSEAGALDVHTTDAAATDSATTDSGADANDSGTAGPTMLWVTNNFGGTNPAVLGFKLSALEAGGEVAPQTTIAGPATTLAGPQCVAFDTSGNLWVVDSPGGGMPGQILKFDAAQAQVSGAPAPSVTIAGGNTKLRNPAGCAFDSAGALWVANLDPANPDNDIVVSFAAAKLASGGNVAPSVSIGNGANLCNTIDLAFDAVGNLWTASLCTYISGYKKSDLATGGSLTPQNKINQATGVDGIAFDSAGNLWTSLQGAVHAVTKFDAASLPTANSNVNASVTISGGNTTIDKPVGVAIANGSLWVAEQGSDKLLRFDAALLASGGNVAPSKVISGAGTKLSSPTRLLAR